MLTTVVTVALLALVAGLVLGYASRRLPPNTGDLVEQVNDLWLCIGCVHCRNACVVDAIVGTQQRMHTVVASECTACEVCVAPCPVDCISMRPLR